MNAVQQIVIYAREEQASQLRSLLPPPYICVLSRAELAAACAGKNCVAFVDLELVDHVDVQASQARIVGISTHAPGKALSEAVHWLDATGWLSHVISSSLLTSPRARAHLEALLQRMAQGPEQAILGLSGHGRTALLASASKRHARFDRMREWFTNNGLSLPNITSAIDVTEELVMNALYDAPAEAGFFERARLRSEDVDLPPDRACEISYGIEGEMVFIRVRDPFGALTRTRLLDVMTRCNSSDVGLDDSRGGAGLGIWRVLQASSTVSITVIPGVMTEFLVGISTVGGRRAVRPAAVHLFFGAPDDSAFSGVAEEADLGLIDQSITFVHVA